MISRQLLFLLSAVCLALGSLAIGGARLSDALWRVGASHPSPPVLARTAAAIPPAELARLVAGFTPAPGVELVLDDKSDIVITATDLALHEAWLSTTYRLVATTGWQWEVRQICAGKGCGRTAYRLALTPRLDRIVSTQHQAPPAYGHYQRKD